MASASADHSLVPSPSQVTRFSACGEHMDSPTGEGQGGVPSLREQTGDQGVVTPWAAQEQGGHQKVRGQQLMRQTTWPTRATFSH